MWQHPRVAATITLISLTVEGPDEFDDMSLSERRRFGPSSTYPVNSGIAVDTFLMKATDTDLGVFDAGETREDGDTVASSLIDRETLASDLPRLERLVETNAAETARALHEYGKERGDLAKIKAALETGEWPTSGDPAEEAAAFARQLLGCARLGKDHLFGVCWEFRGEVALP